MLSDIAENEFDKMESDNSFESVGIQTMLGITNIGKSKTSVALGYWNDDMRNSFKDSSVILKGRLPEKSGEIALE